jgi:predicted nucleic acid-binding protein
MVAAVCSWHEHHPAALEEIDRRLGEGEDLLVPAPALVETYAVLTRLPAPHRLSPADAWALLDANFIQPATLVALPSSSYVKVLRRAVAEGVAGGRTYDVVIAACVRHGRAETVVTLNRRHFDPPPAGVSVVDPSARR